MASRAPKNGKCVMMNAAAHIFDRELLNARRARGAKGFHDYDFLHRFAEAQIKERLEVVKRDFENALELKNQHFDLELEALNISDAPYDLITSALELHTINDLPGALMQVRSALKPDGLFIGAVFGGETLHELRASLHHAEMHTKGGVSPRVFPFADKQQIGGLLQRAGFALPVVDSEIVTVTYDNIFKLMHDLRGMGENNIIHERSRVNPGKAFFMEAAKYYAENYPEDPEVLGGRIVASFEIIFMLGWAPHESQQKPLKPGSAENRLADALKSKESKI